MKIRAACEERLSLHWFPRCSSLLIFPLNLWNSAHVPRCDLQRVKGLIALTSRSVPLRTLKFFTYGPRIAGQEVIGLKRPKAQMRKKESTEKLDE